MRRCLASRRTPRSKSARTAPRPLGSAAPATRPAVPSSSQPSPARTEPPCPRPAEQAERPGVAAVHPARRGGLGLPRQARVHRLSPRRRLDWRRAAGRSRRRRIEAAREADPRPWPLTLTPWPLAAGRIEADMRAAGEDDPLCEWQLCVLLQAAASAGPLRGRPEMSRHGPESRRRPTPAASTTRAPRTRARAPPPPPRARLSLQRRGPLPPGVISRSLAQPRPISPQVARFYVAACARASEPERALQALQQRLPRPTSPED